MNDYPLFTPYPSIEANIIRVILNNGAPYHLSVNGIRFIEPASSCCGGEPQAVLVMDTGRLYDTLHPYSVLNSMFKEWAAANGRGNVA